MPDIEGGISSAGAGAFQTRQYNGAFHTDDSFGYYIQGTVGSGSATFNFRASWSNSIYGNSDTVRPRSVVINFCIKY